MAYKKMSVGKEFTRFDQTGDYVEGYFLRLEDTEIMGRQDKRVVLSDSEGTEIYLPSNYQINEFGKRLIEGGLTGCKVKIVYKGERKISGGRKVKLFDFFVDDEDKIEDTGF